MTKHLTFLDSKLVTRDTLGTVQKVQYLYYARLFVPIYFLVEGGTVCSGVFLSIVFSKYLSLDSSLPKFLVCVSN